MSEILYNFLTGFLEAMIRLGSLYLMILLTFLAIIFSEHLFDKPE